MPLFELVHYFNQRLGEEEELAEEPLELRDGRVAGRFGEVSLTSEFQPIRLAGALSVIIGQDAMLKAIQANTRETSTEQVFSAAADGAPIVNLDRFCRTSTCSISCRSPTTTEAFSCTYIRATSSV